MSMRIPTSTSLTRTYVILGFMSGIFGMLFFTEIFSSAAIVLGAYAWKQEPERSMGLIVLIFGIVSMLVGIYYTAYPLVINFFYTS
nr:hypothetical protein [Candidatus Njordarchaeota archaeon]